MWKVLCLWYISFGARNPFFPEPQVPIISLSQGSDFVAVYIRHLDSPLIKGVDLKNDDGRLPEEIKFVKFSSIIWTPDSKGFFYQVCLSMFRLIPAVIELPSATRTPPTLSK
jgi:hypothetical protein